MGLYDSLRKKTAEAIDSASKKIDAPLSDLTGKLDGLCEAGNSKIGKIHSAASAKLSEAGETASHLSAGVMANIKETKAKVDEWAKTVPDTIHDYSANFNPDDFWDKIKSTASKIGQDLLFMALAMYYTVAELFSKQKETDEK